MSERQAKREKKSVSEVKIKAPADKLTIFINVIVAIVILAVLGLGVYAVGSKYKEMHPSAKTTTVADFIADKGITFEEFKSEYGLEGDEEVTEKSDMNAVSAKFTLENYAKYTDTTLEELKAQYGLGDDVPNETTWQDAFSFMPVGIVAQNMFGTDFETLKTQMGLPETVTAETPWSEVQTIMSELSQQNNGEVPEDGSDADSADEGISDGSDEAVGE